MKQKLSFMQVLFAAFMLFSIFFGAGNMIFPPMMGQLAGARSVEALIGFIVTDVGIALAGVIAVVVAGKNMTDLAGRAGKTFGLIITVSVYLLIGPLFALPRTGAVSFELGVLPFLSQNQNPLWPSLIYTLIFFAVTFFLSLNPNKIVDVVGKILTPLLLISILIIFIGALIHPLGDVSAPTGDYQTIPFFKGMIEGYLALDGFAGLVFAITVIESFRSMGITDKKPQLRYTFLVGAIAGLLLIAVYAALTFVGAQVSGQSPFANGGALLATATHTLFGRFGNIVLAIAIILACLTTSIGLTTSFGDYFSSLFPKIPYKLLIGLICGFSFLISNVGLSVLISIVLPILIALYPVITVLIVLSLFEKKLKDKPEVYWLSMLGAFSISLFDGFRNAGISLGALSAWTAYVPFFQLGIGWILPATIGALIGLTPIGKELHRLILKSK